MTDIKQQQDKKVNRLKRTEVFDEWVKKLKDPVIKGRINKRIKLAEKGNFGDCKSLDDAEGVCEMRFKKTGHRLYYSQHGKRLYWLLVGGDKDSQQRDIEQAISLKRRIDAKAAKMPITNNTGRGF